MALMNVLCTLKVLQCDFCGMKHASLKEAQTHGCTRGELEKTLKVGDIVQAQFHLHDQQGRFMGREMVDARVVSVTSPFHHFRHLTERQPEAVRHLSISMIGFEINWFPHDWLVRLEPCRSPSTEDCVCTFDEFELHWQRKLVEAQAED